MCRTTSWATSCRFNKASCRAADSLSPGIVRLPHSTRSHRDWLHALHCFAARGRAMARGSRLRYRPRFLASPRSSSSSSPSRSSSAVIRLPCSATCSICRSLGASVRTSPGSGSISSRSTSRGSSLTLIRPNAARSLAALSCPPARALNKSSFVHAPWRSPSNHARAPRTASSGEPSHSHASRLRSSPADSGTSCRTMPSTTSAGATSTSITRWSRVPAPLPSPMVISESRLPAWAASPARSSWVFSLHSSMTTVAWSPSSASLRTAALSVSALVHASFAYMTPSLALSGSSRALRVSRDLPIPAGPSIRMSPRGLPIVSRSPCPMGCRRPSSTHSDLVCSGRSCQASQERKGSASPGATPSFAQSAMPPYLLAHCAT